MGCTINIQVQYKDLWIVQTMEIDPYKHEEKYHNWKERIKEGIPNLSKTNSQIVLRYIYDMENGINISSKNVKGSRSYIRLNNLREKSFTKKEEDTCLGSRLESISAIF